MVSLSTEYTDAFITGDRLSQLKHSLRQMLFSSLRQMDYFCIDKLLSNMLKVHGFL